MPTPVSAPLLNTFSGLAQIVYSGDSYDDVHHAICQAAVELVPGCDHASLMISRRGRVHTAAASDAVARACDEAEVRLGEGPCLDAIDDDEPAAHLCTDLRDGCAWPTLASTIYDDYGVRGMAGFRLRQDDTRVGALNVFCDTVGELDERTLEQASLLCSFASVALTAMARGEEAATLRRGLESNREIGKAVGFMMALHGIGDEEAFSLLSKVSQEMNLKVVDVAAQVLEKHDRG